jgi:hypothetical protein
MRRICAAALLMVAAAVGGCGSEDFPNEPRPPAPVELSARIDGGGVQVAPTTVGAGLATITISNQSQDEVQLDFNGPSNDSNRSTNPIPAGGVSSLKLELEQGDYTIEPDVSSIPSDTLTVGPERASAQNELLLP